MTEILNAARRHRNLKNDLAISGASRPASSTPIVGNTVKLVAVDPGCHAATLYNLTHDCDGADTLWDYMGYGPFSNIDEMANWMAACSASDSAVFYTMIDCRTGHPFGMASYLNIHQPDGRIEIGNIWIAPFAQRSALATEAIFLLMTHAMDVLKFRRLEWKCNALNEKSRNAAKRFGFSYEGTFYRHMIVKGKNRDTAWFSITEDEWPQLRTNFETWLSADNFHEDRQQKLSLSSLNWPDTQG